jgi:NADH-quinone oxidoreductase subunit L
MLAPLMVLAVGSIVSGWVGLPAFLGKNSIADFLAPAMTTPAQVEAMSPAAPAMRETAEEQGENTSRELELALASVAVAGAGLYVAWLLYYKRPELPQRITSRIHGIYLMVLHKYYVDEGYGAIFVKPLLALSTVVFWRGIDQEVIDGLVNGAGATSKQIGNELRRMQSGNIRSYAAWMAAGGAAVIAYLVWYSLTGVK